jgi:hypothetical protein
MLCLAFLASLLVSHPVFGQATRDTNRLIRGNGCILLTNGNVLEGYIEPIENRYRIQTTENSAVIIDVERIRYIANTITELYDLQRNSVERMGTGEHLHFAHWCLRNNQLDLAMEHYIALSQSIPENPKFLAIDRKLKAALLADEKTRLAIGLAAKSDPSRSQPNDPSPTADSVYEAQPAFATAASQGFNQKSAPGVVPASATQPPADTTHANSVLASVPPRSIHALQFDLLPIVRNRCGQTACHGTMAKNPFRVPGTEYQNPAIREAFAVDMVTYSSKTTPETSLLIRYATSPHGMQTQPSLNRSDPTDSDLIAVLEEWMRGLDVNFTPTRAALGRLANVVGYPNQSDLHPALLKELQRLNDEQTNNSTNSPISKFNARETLRKLGVEAVGFDAIPMENKAAMPENDNPVSNKPSDAQAAPQIPWLDNLSKPKPVNGATNPGSPNVVGKPAVSESELDQMMRLINSLERGKQPANRHDPAHFNRQSTKQ